MPIRRSCALAALLALAAPAPALAQTTNDGSTGTTTLFIIAGALVLAFLVVGLWIARDARRSLPPEDRDPAPRPHLEPEDRRRARRDQSKAAQRRRAQRAARRRNR